MTEEEKADKKERKARAQKTREAAKMIRETGEYASKSVCTLRWKERAVSCSYCPPLPCEERLIAAEEEFKQATRAYARELELQALEMLYGGEKK